MKGTVITITELEPDKNFPGLRFGWSIDAYKEGASICLAQGTAESADQAESFAFHMAEVLDIEVVSGPHVPKEA